MASGDVSRDPSFFFQSSRLFVFVDFRKVCIVLDGGGLWFEDRDNPQFSARIELSSTNLI
jgi:hypothetical protein